jgi:hypothetical protein
MPMPRGNRPSTAAFASSGARKDSETVKLTCRALHLSRAASPRRINRPPRERADQILCCSRVVAVVVILPVALLGWGAAPDLMLFEGGGGGCHPAGRVAWLGAPAGICGRC